MPIYEYVCSECNSKFEKMRPVSQCGEPAECPNCHKPADRKMSVFSAMSVTMGGAPKPVAGASGTSNCSSCSSGNCSSCAS